MSSDEILAELISLGGIGIVMARSKPCLCGPGFCWNEIDGIGGYGECRGKSDDIKWAKDCKNCNSPEQSDAGCWSCHGRFPEDLDHDPYGDGLKLSVSYGAKVRSRKS